MCVAEIVRNGIFIYHQNLDFECLANFLVTEACNASTDQPPCHFPMSVYDLFREWPDTLAIELYFCPRHDVALLEVVRDVPLHQAIPLMVFPSDFPVAALRTGFVAEAIEPQKMMLVE